MKVDHVQSYFLGKGNKIRSCSEYWGGAYNHKEDNTLASVQMRESPNHTSHPSLIRPHRPLDKVWLHERSRICCPEHLAWKMDKHVPPDSTR